MGNQKINKTESPHRTTTFRTVLSPGSINKRSWIRNWHLQDLAVLGFFWLLLSLGSASEVTAGDFSSRWLAEHSFRNAPVRYFHPIPEGQIYRDFQVTVKDRTVKLKLVARASEKTWSLWIDRTCRKIRYQNQLIDESRNLKQADAQPGKGKIAAASNSDQVLRTLSKLSLPKWIPKNEEQTVKWLQEKKNLQFVLETVTYQIQTKFDGQVYRPLKSEVRHSGRHHWALEMEWDFPLDPKFLDTVSKNRLPFLMAPASMSKTPILPNSPGSLDKSGQFGGAESSGSSNVQIELQKPGEQKTGRHREQTGKTQNSHMTAKKQDEDGKPNFVPNLEIRCGGFADFAGLVRKGMRVRGEAELERTDHSVLVIRSRFEKQKSGRKTDGLRAIVSVPPKK